MTIALLTASTKVAHLAALMAGGTAGPEHFVEPLAQLSAACALFIREKGMDAAQIATMADNIARQMVAAIVPDKPEAYSAEWIKDWISGGSFPGRATSIPGPEGNTYTFDVHGVWRNTATRTWQCSYQEVAAYFARQPDDAARRRILNAAVYVA